MVGKGLLKKKKKPKVEDVPTGSADKGKGKVLLAANKTLEKDKVAMPPPSAIKATAVA